MSNKKQDQPAKKITLIGSPKYYIKILKHLKPQQNWIIIQNISTGDQFGKRNNE